VLRPLATGKNLSIAITIDATLGEVVIDPAKFKQVLYNYLSNAMKFTPEGGQFAIY